MKKNYIILLVGIIFFVNIFPGTSANFLETTHQEYYPTTIFSITLVNISIGNDYSLLIGSDQSIVDSQWYNFTALENKMTFDLKHFHQSSIYDENNTKLDRLQIELYYSDVLQDTTYYDLIIVNEQIKYIGYLDYISNSALLIGLIFVVYILVKYVLVKLLY